MDISTINHSNQYLYHLISTISWFMVDASPTNITWGHHLVGFTPHHGGLGDQQGAHPCASAAAQGMAKLKALKAVAACGGLVMSWENGGLIYG